MTGGKPAPHFLNAKNNGICDALTLLGLGFSLYETGEKTGLNFLIEAFEKDQSPMIRIGLAAVLCKENRFEESLKLFEGISWEEEAQP